MKKLESSGLKLEPEEWCSRFVTAWLELEVPSTRSAWAEAEAAYDVACMLEPEKAAAMIAERSLEHRRSRSKR